MVKPFRTTFRVGVGRVALKRPHSSLGYATPTAYAVGLRLAALRSVATVAEDGDNNG